MVVVPGIENDAPKVKCGEIGKWMIGLDSGAVVVGEDGSSPASLREEGDVRGDESGEMGLVTLTGESGGSVFGGSLFISASSAVRMSRIERRTLS